MARALKAKKLAQIGANREGSIYRLHVEDEADKKTLFELTSDQALLLADTLDKLLADEEEEQRPRPSAPHEAASVRRERLGTVSSFWVSVGSPRRSRGPRHTALLSFTRFIQSKSSAKRAGTGRSSKSCNA